MLHIDAQYIHEQHERLRNFEEWQIEKAEHQVIQLRNIYQDWLRWAQEERDQTLMFEERVSCARIAQVNTKFEQEDSEKKAKLQDQIDSIRAKAQRRINAKREHCSMRCWSCPDDGDARPFEYRGRLYYRIYSGAMWHADQGQLGAFAGMWNGIYLSKGEEPTRPLIAMT
jgi:hypothetical protein